MPYISIMDDLQRRIIDAALPHVSFDGWTMQTLRAAAESAGLPAIDAQRAFPGGVIEAIMCWIDDANEHMEHSLKNDYALDTMRIRDRIATAVMVRLRQNQDHREAARRSAAYLSLPWNASYALKALYNTVDIMWRCAGDTSTDFNFYTKRGLLSKVYMSTYYVWLNDDSENQQDTEAFLRRRIDDVMQIQKFKGKISKWMPTMPFNKAAS